MGPENGLLLKAAIAAGALRAFADAPRPLDVPELRGRVERLVRAYAAA
jgi:hypothetical protein